MKIYFAGAIKGGRNKVDDYIQIVDFLEEKGSVLDKHVADRNLSSKGESVNPIDIYQRDINWINECDILFAEVTNPSLGVGYELAYAEAIGKKIICMCEEDANLSAMIKGNPKFNIIYYSSIENLKESLQEVFK